MVLKLLPLRVGTKRFRKLSGRVFDRYYLVITA